MRVQDEKLEAINIYPLDGLSPYTSSWGRATSRCVVLFVRVG
jgi:hypothetical protein